MKGSVREAVLAEQIAPGAVQTELALGDAQLAAGNDTEARAAYGRAQRAIDSMEPEAREVWTARLRAKQ